MFERPASRPATAMPATSPAGDEDLIVRILEGSQEALAELYDRHAGMIFASALRLLGDRSDAEEVVQETFLALWNRAGQFDPARGSARNWLASIARNRAIDRARASLARVRASTFSSVMDGEDADAEGDDWLLATAEPVAVGAAAALPEEALVDGETKAALRVALEMLEPPERDVIVLAYRDQLSQSEIAQRLQWPLGTVKTRTRRALLRLRAALEEIEKSVAPPAGRRTERDLLPQCCGAS